MKVFTRYCAGQRRDRTPCLYVARPGSRYCARHVDQTPQPPQQWLAEGVTTRYSPTRLHLLVADVATVLCTGHPGRLHAATPGELTLCPRCHALVRAAVLRGEVEPDHLRRWNLGEPNVDERAVQS